MFVFPQNRQKERKLENQQFVFPLLFFTFLYDQRHIPPHVSMTQSPGFPLPSLACSLYIFWLLPSKFSSFPFTPSPCSSYPIPRFLHLNLHFYSVILVLCSLAKICPIQKSRCHLWFLVLPHIPHPITGRSFVNLSRIPPDSSLGIYYADYCSSLSSDSLTHTIQWSKAHLLLLPGVHTTYQLNHPRTCLVFYVLIYSNTPPASINICKYVCTQLTVQLACTYSFIRPHITYTQSIHLFIYLYFSVIVSLSQRLS
jgi:hypothetical protein